MDDTLVGWVSRPGKKGKSPSQRRKEARLQVDAQWPTVCKTLLEKATDGDMVALRMVMEMAGLGTTDAEEAGVKKRQARHVSFVKKTLAELKAKA